MMHSTTVATATVTMRTCTFLIFMTPVGFDKDEGEQNHRDAL